MVDGQANLPPILRQISMLYAELIKIGIIPIEADKHELWQIAALMGSSVDPNDPEEINRRMIAERYRAASEGRELDPTTMVGAMSDEQVRVLGG